MSFDVSERTPNTPAIRRPCVVISQPMYFPWVGILEQVRLCDTFIFYDDVQYARGFINRVQIKTNNCTRWLTAPLLNLHRGQLINQVNLDMRANWRRSQRDLLLQAYAKAPYKLEMLALVDEIFSREYDSLADLSKASTMALIRYFYLESNRRFLDASAFAASSTGTQRLVDLCVKIDAKTYLTGHGAQHYLEHERFETKDIDVAYIDYGLRPYPQGDGAFTPYVSALDLVAYCGKAGVELVGGEPVAWREFLSKHINASRQEHSCRI